MKQVLELLPIILFFGAYQMDGRTIEFGGYSYQFDGLYSATLVLMIATSLQVLITWVIERKLEKRLLWLFAAIMIFGGATLLFRNQAFIQWKPTVFNWALAIVFIVSQLTGKNLMERALGSQLTLPKPVWKRLNYLWITNFVVVGALNIYVAYQYSESTWVSYKLYSSIGFTVVMTLLTVILISPYLKDQAALSGPDNSIDS